LTVSKSIQTSVKTSEIPIRSQQNKPRVNPSSYAKVMEIWKMEKFWSWVDFGFDFGAPPQFPGACLEFSPKRPGATRVIFFLTRSCSRVFSPETRSATRSCCRSEFFFFLNWLDLGLAPIEEEEELEESIRSDEKKLGGG
jgi:hypothetical protein